LQYKAGRGKALMVKRPAPPQKVPSDLNKSEYKTYLRSDHWKELRRRKYSKCPNRCAICGSAENLQLHHLQYRSIYDVETSDLRCLCGMCHKTFHDLAGSGQLRITSDNHHGIFCQTKTAVKKARGLYGNQFYPADSGDCSLRVAVKDTRSCA
jgi:hypothetical protein